MIKWLKRIVITGVLVVGTLSNQGSIGVTETVCQAEDNSIENGFYYKCSNGMFIDMNETYLHKRIIYFQDNRTKKVMNLLSLN